MLMPSNPPSTGTRPPEGTPPTYTSYRHAYMRRAHAVLLAVAAAASPPPPPLTRPPLVHQRVGAWTATFIIGTHHKTGTVLLAKVFRIAAKLMGVQRVKSNRTLSSSVCGEQLAHGAPGVCIIEHVTARDVRQWLLPPPAPPTPFVHAVRDPVEMCVSAYQYHLLGAEPWLVQPMRDLNGSTLQQHYKRVSPAEGVRFECMRMALELVETALVYNATRDLANALTVRLEDFSRDYDGTMRHLFAFLGSGSYVESLVKAAAPYDLARAPAGDARHVSASSSKQTLREMLLADPRLGALLGGLRELLGYPTGAGAAADGRNTTAGGAAHAHHHQEHAQGRSPLRPEALCEQLVALCATTRVGFFQWCSYGHVPRGRIPSLADCGEEAHAHPTRGGSGAARTALDAVAPPLH
jgi:hypothetical protein